MLQRAGSPNALRVAAQGRFCARAALGPACNRLLGRNHSFERGRNLVTKVEIFQNFARWAAGDVYGRKGCCSGRTVVPPVHNCDAAPVRSRRTDRCMPDCESEVQWCARCDKPGPWIDAVGTTRSASEGCGPMRRPSARGKLRNSLRGEVAEWLKAAVC